MVKLLGEELSKTELTKRFGDYNHLVGFQHYKLNNGKEKDVEVVQVSTGTGFRFEVLKSRGLDIGRCYYKEIPISFRSCVSESYPSFYEAFNDGWLRSYSGGLLTTCGLTSIGTPINDKGEILPLHGRLSNIPSESFYTKNRWKNDDLYLDVNGSVREAKALNYNLLLERCITAKAGTNAFHIHDIVTNEGFTDTEHMILYHFNIGYPILDRNLKLYMKSISVNPRDEAAKNRNDKFDEFLDPTHNYPDVVYYHNLKPDYKGECQVAVVNEKRNIGFYLKFSKKSLDQFTQWKFMGEGNYVIGLEPGNARVNGRNVERRSGRLKVLKAQTSVEYDIEVGFLSERNGINQFLKKYDLK